MLFLHVLLPTCHRAIKDGQRRTEVDTRCPQGGKQQQAEGLQEDEDDE